MNGLLDTTALPDENEPVARRGQAPPPRATPTHGLAQGLLGEVLCAGAVEPQSFLGQDGCARPLSPARCWGQVRREALLSGRGPIPGPVLGGQKPGSRRRGGSPGVNRLRGSLRSETPWPGCGAPPRRSVSLVRTRFPSSRFSRPVCRVSWAAWP